MTKAQLKRIACEALYSEYGFAPATNKIVLLEANGEGTYILFEVNGRPYRFDSITLTDGSVYCGKNTITKEEYV